MTDTHALLWHMYESKKLSDAAKEIFVNADAGDAQIIIPAIVLIEIVYLAEKERIAVTAVIDVLKLLSANADNYVVADLNIGVVMALQKIERTQVPDMPDRIIAATALHLDVPLLTRDLKIQALPNLTVVW